MKAGLLAPLGVRVYRALWMASVASNIGTLMHGVGVAWLMTTLTDSPLLVALVPVAALTPVFLLGLLGGVFADRTDRRLWLLGTQTWMMMCALALGVATVCGAIHPAGLLAANFALGVGTALNIPAWQSLMQDIVPRGLIASAVSLNSISFNTGRMLGPVLGGLIVSLGGPATVFFLNAASFSATVVVLSRWQGTPARPVRRGIWGSLGEGFSYLARSPHIAPPILRAALFTFLSGGTLALLPVVAREVLDADAAEFGLLLGAFGVGSLSAGTAVPTLRQQVPPSTLVAIAMAVGGTGMGGLALAGNLPFAAMALFACGASWVTSLVNLNVSVQTSVPAAFRGRMLAVYFTAFQAAFALGAFVSGCLAKAAGTGIALAAASVAAILLAPLTAKFPLPDRPQRPFGLLRYAPKAKRTRH